MTKIMNPNSKLVQVGHWVLAPNSSKATHIATGQVVEQLSDEVAAQPVVQDFLKREVLQSDPPYVVPSSEEVPSVRISKSSEFIKKHKK